MKRFAVIGVSLLAALAVLAYVLMVDRSADPENTNGDPPADTRGLSDLPDPVSSSTAVGEKADPAAKAITGQESWRTTKSGVKTEFYLYKGEIGYVDVDSVVEDRNPYSVVALLQEHDAYTGAGQLLELEIEWVGHHTKSYDVEFFQMIGGIPTEARGSLGFDPSGLVSWVDGDLFDTEVAEAGNILILQSEAEAIAYEAAVRFVDPRRAPFAERGKPLRIEVMPAELRYAEPPHASNALRAEWRVVVSTFSPTDVVEVLVTAQKGQIVGMQSLVQDVAAQTGCTGCTGLKFRVCDGADAQEWSCTEPGAGTTPIFDGDQCVADETDSCVDLDYTAVRDNANDARDYVSAMGTQYLRGLGGSDCKIDIVVNVSRSEFSGLTLGRYVEAVRGDGVILISEPFPDTQNRRWVFPAQESVVPAHELFHAVSRGLGKVEHGLVYSMDALYEDGDEIREWNGPDGSLLSTDQVIHEGDKLEVVGNAMYRIYKKIRQMQTKRPAEEVAKEVFRFALEVDRERTTSLYSFRRALVKVAKEEQFSDAIRQAVGRVLLDMGINDLPLGVIPDTILRIMERELREIAGMVPEDATIGAALEEAMRRLRDYLGLDDDQVLRGG